MIVVLKNHPFDKAGSLGGCCLWGGVLCENCIVDANAIKNNNLMVVVCFFFFVVLFLVFFVVCA